MDRISSSWIRSAGSLRIVIPALVVVLGVGGYLLTSSTIQSDRDSAASRRAQVTSLRTEGYLGRARAYVGGLGNTLADEPVGGQRRFARVVGSTASSSGLADVMWVESKGSSRLIATYTSRSRGDLRPGVDVSDWPALGAAVRERATAFAVSASQLGSLGGEPGFYLVDAGTFGRAPSSRGFLVVFVPRGWLTTSLESDPRRLAISLDGRRLEGALDSASAASASFETLGRRWSIDMGREPPTRLQATLPWLALGWPLAVALLAFLIGRAIVLRRRAEREVEQIFDLSRDLLGIAGLDGYFKRVNPAFERTFGYSTEELLSRPFMELVHPEDLERSNETMEVLSRGQEVSQFENRNIRSDGSVRWIQWSTRPVPDEGIVYSIGRDVTDSRRTAEEQAALRRVATLVARGVPAAELFDAVMVEVRALFDADLTILLRYEPDDAVATLLAVQGDFGELAELTVVGTRVSLEGDGVMARAQRTSRPVRLDTSAAARPVVDWLRKLGIRASIGVPIVVEGRVWGVTVASWTDDQPPEDAESRIAAFGELVATAIANAESREALGRLADEQAALRRVATLVAERVPAAELLAAVTEEVGALLPVTSAAMGRYDSDGMFTTVAAWSKGAAAFPVGRRWVPGGKNVMTIVFETGRPARIDSFADASGPVGVVAREAGYRSAVGTPIMVEGRLWGVATAASSAEQPLPSDTEARLASFTELVATAIANAEGRAELTASRARVVAAADETRRRIERDLHDGTQQRLISLVLSLRAAEGMVPSELDGLRGELAQVASGLVEATDDLREISRGIHPAILSKGGLGPALKTLTRRAAMPVKLDVHVDERLPEPVEVAAYYVVSEALANAARHAQASAVDVALNAEDSVIMIAIHDNGVGGADPGGGSGLTGLRDRIEALGGTLEIVSNVGRGTSLQAKIPLDGADAFERFSGGA